MGDERVSHATETTTRQNSVMAMLEYRNIQNYLCNNTTVRYSEDPSQRMSYTAYTLVRCSVLYYRILDCLYSTLGSVWSSEMYTCEVRGESYDKERCPYCCQRELYCAVYKLVRKYTYNSGLLVLLPVFSCPAHSYSVFSVVCDAQKLPLIATK